MANSNIILLLVAVLAGNINAQSTCNDDPYKKFCEGISALGGFHENSLSACLNKADFDTDAAVFNSGFRSYLWKQINIKDFNDDESRSCVSILTVVETYAPQFVLDSLASYCRTKKQNTEKTVGLKAPKKCKGRKAKKSKKCRKLNNVAKECKQLVKACSKSSSLSFCKGLKSKITVNACAGYATSPLGSLELNANTNDADGDGTVTFGEVYDDLVNHYDNSDVNEFGNEDGFVQKEEWMFYWERVYKFPRGFSEQVWDGFSANGYNDTFQGVDIEKAYGLEDRDTAVAPRSGFLQQNGNNLHTFCINFSNDCYCQRLAVEEQLCDGDDEFRDAHPEFCEGVSTYLKK